MSQMHIFIGTTPKRAPPKAVLPPFARLLVSGKSFGAIFQYHKVKLPAGSEAVCNTWLRRGEALLPSRLSLVALTTAKTCIHISMGCRNFD